MSPEEKAYDVLMDARFYLKASPGLPEPEAEEAKGWFKLGADAGRHYALEGVAAMMAVGATPQELLDYVAAELKHMEEAIDRPDECKHREWLQANESAKRQQGL